MDDIYGDLDNYNNVNAIDELRNENLELKFKLEECASNMSKLQKDFDKLSTEFKKLEINYSSLLKTARAEIERKTQIITNLNLEKDKMVLHTIQNSNQRLAFLKRNIIRDKSNNRKPYKDVELQGVKTSMSSKEFPEIIKCDPVRERNEEKRLPSTDTVFSGNTDECNKVNNDDKLLKLASYEKTSDGKENVKGKRAQGLRNRRKSMPSTSHKFAKFSSDEEYEENYSCEEPNKRERLVRDDKYRKNVDRHKQNHKISETSGIDEKYSSYHESSRETYYKGKSNRYSDKYRSGRDRYDSQRNKRYLSPERNRRGPRDYPDVQYQRQEYGRHRMLESPPFERYDSRRYDRRSNYDKDDVYGEKYLSHCERLAVKHKASSDYDEPSGKRLRTDSISKPTEEDIKVNKDRRMLPEFSEHLQHTSCQSPDYTHPDTVLMQPVKEIMNTAATNLEDPRLVNKKYVKQMEGDKVTLSTVIGRDVDIKVIDTSTWDMQRVEVPAALQRPPQYSDRLVQELYMDIDNPVSNFSMESGEVYSETNDDPITDYVTESFLQDYENERENQRSTIYDIKEPEIQTNDDFTKDKLEDCHGALEQQEHTLVNEDNTTKAETSKYKIPKLKKPDLDSPSVPNPIGVLLNQLHSACGLPQDIPIIKPKDNKIDVDQSFGTDDDNDIHHRDDKNKNKRKQSSDRQIVRKLSAKEIVEGDLELSDETIDTVDIKQRTKRGKVKEKVHNGNESKILETTSENPQKNHQTKEVKTKKLDIKNKGEMSSETITEEITDNRKNKKAKKKSPKEKVVTRTEIYKDGLAEKATEKKTRERKPKVSKDSSKTQVRKAKFSDLFGESSSLMTPEDLGITMPQTETELSNKNYVPICEDAQDAIDVNVKLTEPEQVRIEESKTNAKIDKNDHEHDENHATLIPRDACLNITKKQMSDETTSVIKVTPNMRIIDTKVPIKESDVVKTFIISTGVQPRVESAEPTTNVVNGIKNETVTGTNIPSVPALALATSTPYKNHVLFEKDVVSSCNTSVAEAQREVSTDQSSLSNVVNNKTEDVPDVRIFVRRRRKFKK